MPVGQPVLEREREREREHMFITDSSRHWYNGSFYAAYIITKLGCVAV